MHMEFLKIRKWSLIKYVWANIVFSIENVTSAVYENVVSSNHNFYWKDFEKQEKKTLTPMPKTYFQNEMKGYVAENILVLKHIHDNTRCILKVFGY